VFRVRNWAAPTTVDVSPGIGFLLVGPPPIRDFGSKGCRHQHGCSIPQTIHRNSNENRFSLKVHYVRSSTLLHVIAGGPHHLTYRAQGGTSSSIWPYVYSVGLHLGRRPNALTSPPHWPSTLSRGASDTLGSRTRLLRVSSVWPHRIGVEVVRSLLDAGAHCCPHGNFRQTDAQSRTRHCGRPLFHADSLVASRVRGQVHLLLALVRSAGPATSPTAPSPRHRFRGTRNVGLGSDGAHLLWTGTMPGRPKARKPSYFQTVGAPYLRAFSCTWKLPGIRAPDQAPLFAKRADLVLAGSCAASTVQRCWRHGTMGWYYLVLRGSRGLYRFPEEDRGR